MKYLFCSISIFVCTFVGSQQFRRNPRLFLNDKPLSTGSYRENAATPVLDCCDSPKGSGAYKHFFDMSQGKTFVAKGRLGRTVTETDITDIFHAIRHICTIDRDQKILRTLHHMYLSSVRAREFLPDGELDNISTLYECLKDFYELTAKEVRDV